MPTDICLKLVQKSHYSNTSSKTLLEIKFYTAHVIKKALKTRSPVYAGSTLQLTKLRNMMWESRNHA